MFDYLANPTRFRKITAALLPVVVMVSAIAFALGLYLAFFASPADYQQGETVRIMYIHVPAAWMAMLTYILMAVAAIFYLVWRHPLADIGARAMALPGAGFALITLLTGSFWGRPMWGAQNKKNLNKIICIGGPDKFLTSCGNQEEARKFIGLTAENIFKRFKNH